MPKIDSRPTEMQTQKIDTRPTEMERPKEESKVIKQEVKKPEEIKNPFQLDDDDDDDLFGSIATKPVAVRGAWG